MTVYGYTRVSTDEQATGYGLAAQRRMITAEADRRGWPVEWVTDEGFSGKDLNRPALSATLAALGFGDVLVVAKLDRLSRSLVDFASLMARARDEGWSLVALDLGVDTTTPQGEMMANVMAAFAQYERQIIAERTKVALAEAQRRGVRVGRPRETPQRTVNQIVTMRNEGMSLAAIAEQLTQQQVPTARGGARWYGSSVKSVLDSVKHDRYLAEVRRG